MIRIGLVVTGDMEQLALADSLQAAFPSGEFMVVRKVNGFTGGAPLQASVEATRAPTRTPNARSDVKNFAETLRAALKKPPRRRAPHPEYIIGIDDLELMNDAHPGRAVQYLAAELRRQVDELDPRDGTVEYEQLRERCSFHLFKPMPEAYFFGEEAALVRAGKLPEKMNRFDPDACDVEEFLVDDPDYLKPCDVPNHWRRPDRQRHPKHYLRFLSDPEVPPGDPIKAAELGRTWSYQEMHQGAAALRQLDWKQVLRDPEHAQLARSLLCDIASMLDVPEPFPGQCHPVTCSTERQRLLRNI